MKYLGLDLGTKSLGLAISDNQGLISLPFKVLKHNDDYPLLISLLQDIIENENIERLVLGWPKNMNNTEGIRAQKTREFKELLEKNIAIPVELIDERLSSLQAEKYLIDNNMRRNKRKKVIDALAASIILESFLERKKNEQNTSK